MSGGRFADTLGYRPERPVKCCANCAFSDFSEPRVSCRCSLKASDCNESSVVETCGICSRWLSRGIALAARECASFEEFRLKRDIIDETAYTPELDEWFSERKATGRMIDLALKMRKFAVDWRFLQNASNPAGKTSGLLFSRFPLMVKPDRITDAGVITQLYSSDAFYSVQHWISENKPAYDELLGRKRKRLPFESPDVTVRPFMNSNVSIGV